MPTKTLLDRLKTDWPHKAVAACVLLVTFIIYNATKAPTLSFWDCGEFIACSYILGIPHPPGTPLYILLGRIFSTIPFHADISARINMFSAMSGAAAAMLAFLVTFRLIRSWWHGDTLTGWRKAAAYIGALVGTAMFAFGRTHWNNSMEAEVYTPAMLSLMLIFWLLLRWLDSRHEPAADKYLVAIVYLGFLSIGIHMTTFLFMPAVFLTVVLVSPRLRRDFRFYITSCCLFLMSFSLDLFIYATAIWLAVLLLGTVITRQYAWRFSLMLVAAAVIALTCQLYTPIRSAQKPSINQNDPASSWQAFKRVLERKQYGEVNMVERALTRRGEWKNQLGTYNRMGFWGFFSNQYGITGRSFAFIFVLGLLGIFELVRRRPKLGWPFFFMVILGTLFLVWYMNFADGTRQDPISGEGHIEVRDRDYFFTPGFILFGIAIGMGVAGLIDMARESIFRKYRALHIPVMVLVSALVLLAVVPVQANYFSCDRSRNYIPYDFADNLLTSCDQDAILFIGGDNDTFTVWCLQEVYGVRLDVLPVNLALSNSRWYIKFIRDHMGIPIRWTDAMIDALRHRMMSDGRLIRVQDQVMEEILNVNQWKRPVNYALTVGEENMLYRGRSMSRNLAIQGMVYQLSRDPQPGSIDMEKTRRFFFEQFKFRSIADSTVYKDERTQALSGNYTTVLTRMADSLRRAKQFDGAIELTEKAIELVPFEYQSHNYLAQLYVEGGYEDRIPGLLAAVPSDRVNEIYFIWGMSNRYAGNRGRAKTILKTVLDSFPTFEDAFREYTLLLYEDKQMDELQETIRTWLINNPKDDKARRLMTELFRSPPGSQSP